MGGKEGEGVGWTVETQGAASQLIPVPSLPPSHHPALHLTHHSRRLPNLPHSRTVVLPLVSSSPSLPPLPHPSSTWSSPAHQATTTDRSITREVTAVKGAR